MSYDFEELLGEDFNGNVPATTEKIAVAERSLGKSLPDDFRQFLYVTNGGEGSIGENYVMLWNTGELGEYNESYLVEILVLLC
jgi:cell wall assembly regulator SMI1